MPDRRACLAALYSCLAAGADVNARDSRGCTALQLAAGNQNAAAASKSICMLIEEGADVRAKCPDSGLESLHIAAGNSRNPMAAAAAMQALVAGGADVRARDCEGHEPLHCAADNSNAAAASAAVQALLAAGADVRARDGDGAEPLHWAAANSDAAAAFAAVQALVAAGADVRARDDEGDEPLHWAASYSHGPAVAAAAVQALVAAGADVRARGKGGAEPLHHAAQNLNYIAAVAAVQALLAAGADPSACDSDGSPPLLLVLERHDAADCYQLLWLLVPGGNAESEKSENGSGSSSSGPKGNAAELLELAAAGFRQLLQRTGPATTAVQPVCVVCLDAPRSVALSPCGHLALCGACAAKKGVAKQCPVCRKRAHKALTIYHP